MDASHTARTVLPGTGPYLAYPAETLAPFSYGTRSSKSNLHPYLPPCRTAYRPLWAELSHDQHPTLACVQKLTYMRCPTRPERS